MLKKNYTFSFSFSIRKISSLSAKKRKEKFRKESNLPSRALLFLSNYFDIEYKSAESLTNKYKLLETKSKMSFSLAPSKKYVLIEKFKNELRSF